MVASLSATLLATSPTGKVPSPENSRFPMWRLADARSIAATARNGGVLTLQMGCPISPPTVLTSTGTTIQPPISPGCTLAWASLSPKRAGIWPQHRRLAEQIPLPDNLLLTVAAAIYDPVTTTDELIPSGETSSYRSNPIRLSEFALSRKDPSTSPEPKPSKGWNSSAVKIPQPRR